MNILVNDGKKLIYVDASRVEAEDGTLRIYESGSESPVTSIIYDQYENHSAEEEARLSLLYLVDEIEGDAKAGHIKSDYRFVIKDNNIVRADKIEAE